MSLWTARHLASSRAFSFLVWVKLETWMTLPDSEITIPAYPCFLLRVETRNLLTLRSDSTRAEDLIWDLVACISLVLVVVKRRFQGGFL